MKIRINYNNDFRILPLDVHINFCPTNNLPKFYNNVLQVNDLFHLEVAKFVYKLNNNQLQ